ncbi:TIGR04141 family sporadically distributed protein [Treponema denticola]|nr:TIGR04141 family sporadically distributed protein [Treponema denticola]
MKNQSTRAILFLKTKSRIFAFTFGYGRCLLRDELIVNDFGFRIAINAIDPKQIRSLDTAKLEALTVQSRI